MRRRGFLLGAGAVVVSAAGVRLGNGAETDLIWGVNGHPITAYPGIPFKEQLDLVASLGMTHYRINTRGDGSPAFVDEMLRLAEKRGLTIVPILYPEVDIGRDPIEKLRSAAFELGKKMVRRFKGQITVWELANELENFAIVKPCEMLDDGTQYPCTWGPAGGVGPLEYFGPRWKRVSAVLSGLSEGVGVTDPSAKRAIGTAGWGHLGAFDRMKQDGIEWEITVWHDHGGVSDDYLARLASFGKPIWITEFSAASGEELAARVAHYRKNRARYRVEAAFVYELLDEPYWGASGEARMGMFAVAPDTFGGLRVGAAKPGGLAIKAAIAARP